MVVRLKALRRQRGKTARLARSADLDERGAAEPRVSVPAARRTPQPRTPPTNPPRRKPPRYRAPASPIKAFAMVGAGLLLVVSAQIRTVAEGVVHAFSR
ncbi:MAG: hypothetical protein JWM79_393 [Nocardioides sp.]|nr:hypothetical protein [Nocardioides sp.]